jgi:outer membrane protein OmpA-like peptidoglycan-associated protein
MSEIVVSATAARRNGNTSEHPSVSSAATLKPAGRVLMTATVLCLALSGCETVKSLKDKFNSDAPAEHSEQKASSAEPADSRKSAVIAAGVDSLGDSAVNAYMDGQEATLRRQLEGTGVSVTRSGDSIVLSMPGNVTFASNSSDVSSKVRPVLDSLGIVFNEYDSTYVDVIGYTDSRGSKKYNQRLSEKRARSVAEYLERRRVMAERIVTTGMGEAHPVATNDTSDGRALNRRVEIKLTPIT